MDVRSFGRVYRVNRFLTAVDCHSGATSGCRSSYAFFELRRWALSLSFHAYALGQPEKGQEKDGSAAGTGFSATGDDIMLMTRRVPRLVKIQRGAKSLNINLSPF